MPWLTRPLDYTPRRVVSLNPSITEFLYVAGLGDRLVGRDVFSYRPREALKVPHMASFIHADMEAVRAAKPDLIVVYHPVQRDLIGPLDEIAPVAVVETPTSIDDVVGNFMFVARLLDADEQGEHISGIYRDLLRGAAVAQDALVVFQLGGYDVACRESFTASALEEAGIKYVRSLHCVYHFLGPLEQIVGLVERTDPALIIYEGKTKTPRLEEAAWVRAAKCRACSKGEVLVVPNDTLAHYGPSLPLDVQIIREAVVKGVKVVASTSSVSRPSLGDNWYRPYLK
ncbi:MAG: ABC transporter substrate-binding protein [Thermoproteus sp.]